MTAPSVGIKARIARARSSDASRLLRPVPFDGKGERGLLRRLPAHGYAPGLDHDLDRVLDPVPGIAQRRGQIFQGESMGVNLGRIEALLAHERLGAMRGAPAFAADAIEVNI